VKVKSNPARDVDHRKEPEGRARYLTADEYNRLHKIISERFPSYLAEFVVHAMPERSKNRWLLVARQQTFVLFMACYGRRIDEGYPGGSGSQDHHHGCQVQSPVTRP